MEQYNNELSSSNTFFTPIVEPKEINLIEKENEDIDPMSQVDKLSTPYNDAQKEAADKNLKDASLTVFAHSKSISKISGQNKKNSKYFYQKYKIKLSFKKDNTIDEYDFKIAKADF